MAIENPVLTLTLPQLVAAGHPDFWRNERVNSLTLRALFEELRNHLDPMKNEASPFKGLDYFSSNIEWTRGPGHKGPVLQDTTKLGDVRYSWIAVFPVTGANEGHYVHVDLIVDWRERPGQFNPVEVRIPLFLAKTFGGTDEAIALAGELARLLGV